MLIPFCNLLLPLVGEYAGLIFALALLFAGFSSTITAGMAGGSIYAGIFKEPYDIKDRHSWLGVATTYSVAVLIILFITSPFEGLVYSQMFLSIQLPWTIFLQIYLAYREYIAIFAENLTIYRDIAVKIAYPLRMQIYEEFLNWQRFLPNT